MSPQDNMPAPLESIVRAVAGGSGGNEQRASTFARGLAIGALVGAAIAGSTIWQRRHALPRKAIGAESRQPTTPAALPVDD